MTFGVYDAKKQKRKAPISKKKCDNCLRIFNVPSSRQFCKDKTCEGTLELIAKEKKITMAKVPKCDKRCEKCFSSYFQVPCATKKCKCGHILSKVVLSDITDKYLDVNGMILFVDPID
tara:strand:+ start:624 stop:977 length:354 start_codon:yes stop_codon:yes gene_type:complete